MKPSRDRNLSPVQKVELCLRASNLALAALEFGRATSPELAGLMLRAMATQFVDCDRVVKGWLAAPDGAAREE